MAKKYKILFQKSAYKEFIKLPKKIHQRVGQVLEILSLDPLSEVLKFKKIRGKENHFRIRVGDYRIIYSPQNQKLIIKVIRIGHRKDIYRYY